MDCRDFYLYVWVCDASEVTAFQAVLDETFVATFKSDAPPSFGTVERRPFNRAVNESALPQPRLRMLETLGKLDNGDFPHLVSSLGDIAAAQSWRVVRLSASERRLLKRLLANKGK
jgi:hypothetical protein